MLRLWEEQAQAEELGTEAEELGTGAEVLGDNAGKVVEGREDIQGIGAENLVERTMGSLQAGRTGKGCNLRELQADQSEEGAAGKVGTADDSRYHKKTRDQAEKAQEE